MNIHKTIAFGLLAALIAATAACGGNGQDDAAIVAPDDSGSDVAENPPENSIDENIAPETPSEEKPVVEEAAPASDAPKTYWAIGNTIPIFYAFAPTVVESMPASGKDNVGTGAVVKVTFSQPMDLASVKAHFKVKIFALFGWVDIDGTIATEDAKIFTFKPADLLKKGAMYGIVVEKGTQSEGENGQSLEQEYTSGFTTVAN